MLASIKMYLNKQVIKLKEKGIPLNRFEMKRCSQRHRKRQTSGSRTKYKREQKMKNKKIKT